ncbi:MAG: 1-acyl-sn-glycerol-3-phosphate acyltransferase [Acidobacteria bacterium]|nr:1-acyl-sn-glycerol-3-phosphate acyltransferase [Acidobacteriota bacterium]
MVADNPGWLEHCRTVIGAELPHMPSRRERGLARGQMLVFGRFIEVEGADRLASLPDPVLFALNHNNTLESVLVPTALIFLRGGRHISFLVDWMYLRNPLLGWLLRRIDPVPVYTKRALWGLWEEYRRAHLGESPLDGCLERLAAGRSVGIFPEGTRNPSATRLRRGRPGLGRLVLESTAPVVPVGIDFPAKERLGRVPAIGRMRLRIGAPMRFEPERGAYREVTVVRPASRERSGRELGAAVVDQVMHRLATLSGKSYPFGRPAAVTDTVSKTPFKQGGSHAA